jgi:NAD(P)-dependent dehydrogenase (short-subunit alcohol dehydrogenase family)
MGRLEGKVAVITGGNSGIGLATAKEFKEQGARVVITGRDQKTLDEAKREIGGDVLAVRSDTSSLTEIDKLFAAVKDLRKPDARRSSLGDKLTIGNFGKGINKIDDEVWYGMLWLTFPLLVRLRLCRLMCGGGYAPP